MNVEFIGQQSQPDLSIKEVFTNLEDRIYKIRQTIQDILVLLEMEEKVPWVELNQLFCSLSNQYSSLQSTLKKSGFQQSDDMSQTTIADMFKKTIIVPTGVSLDQDLRLQQISEGRLISWNHEVLPQYLKIRPTQQAIDEEQMFESDMNVNKQPENLAKQMKAFNGHIDNLTQRLKGFLLTSQQPSKRTEEARDSTTRNLLKAIFGGEGLIPPKQDFIERTSVTPRKQ